MTTVLIDYYASRDPRHNAIKTDDVLSGAMGWADIYRMARHPGLPDRFPLYVGTIRRASGPDAVRVFSATRTQHVSGYVEINDIRPNSPRRWLAWDYDHAGVRQEVGWSSSLATLVDVLVSGHEAADYRGQGWPRRISGAFIPAPGYIREYQEGEVDA